VHKKGKILERKIILHVPDRSHHGTNIQNNHYRGKMSKLVKINYYEIQGTQNNIVQCRVVLARFCPIIVQVRPLKTPFGLVTPFITIPITRSYNHTQLLLTPLRGYTVTILARLCLQPLIARLHRWLSTLCVDYRLLAVGLRFNCWLLSSPAGSLTRLQNCKLKNWLCWCCDPT
jgi:hypothetical protein